MRIRLRAAVSLGWRSCPAFAPPRLQLIRYVRHPSVIKETRGHDPRSISYVGSSPRGRASSDRARHTMLYRQFVDSWDGRFVYHAPEGVPREAPCEVHFGWALEGRCSGRLDHALAVGATSPRRVGAGYACMAAQCASTIREAISGTSSGSTR